MKMSGEQLIAAPRARVWDALNDPEVLKQCIPGCQSLEKEADDRLKATVAIKIGPIGAKFNGAVTLSELDPPNSYVISGEGQGGTAGFARGSASVKLAEEGNATRLTYDVDAEVGGRLAQVGGPIVDATAKQLAGTFFKKFGAIVTASEQTAAAAESAPAAAPAAASAVATQPTAASVGAAATAPALTPALPLALRNRQRCRGLARCSSRPWPASPPVRVMVNLQSAPSWALPSPELQHSATSADAAPDRSS